MGGCLLIHFRGVRLCDPTDCSPPGSSIHRIFQARMLAGVGCHVLLRGDLSDQGIKLRSLVSPALEDGLFTTGPVEKSQVDR